MINEGDSEYYAVVALDFPGYRSVPVKAPSDEGAIARVKELASSGKIFDFQETEGSYDIQWDLAGNERVVALWRNDSDAPLLEGPFEDASDTLIVDGTAGMISSLVKELCADVYAEHWCEVRQHGDKEAIALSTRMPVNIGGAATLLQHQFELLTRMRDHLLPATTFGGIESMAISHTDAWRERGAELVTVANAMIGHGEHKSLDGFASMGASGPGVRIKTAVVGVEPSFAYGEGPFIVEPLFASFPVTPELLVRLESLRDLAVSHQHSARWWFMHVDTFGSALYQRVLGMC